MLSVATETRGVYYSGTAYESFLLNYACDITYKAIKMLLLKGSSTKHYYLILYELKLRKAYYSKKIDLLSFIKRRRDGWSRGGLCDDKGNEFTHVHFLTTIRDGSSSSRTLKNVQGHLENVHNKLYGDTPTEFPCLYTSLEYRVRGGYRWELYRALN